MDVYQIRIRVFLLQSIPANQVQAQIAAFIDSSFIENEELLQFHKENKFKNYCQDCLYPIEADKIYKKGNIYTVTIRTIDTRLAKHFSEVCVNHYTDEIKGLTAEIRIIPKKTIECLYSVTPVILKSDEGYWRGHMKLEEYEYRLKTNLVKKWNAFHNEKLSEDFQLYTMLEFLNKGPLTMEYKNITLLGDKIRIHIADNKTAQDLSYMALATGVLENNSRGAGFVNYRWL